MTKINTESIYIDKNLENLWADNDLDPSILRYLITIINFENKKSFPIVFTNNRRDNLLNFYIKLLCNHKQIKISNAMQIFNLFELEKIVENAAIAFFLSFFLIKWKVIPRVIRKRGGGYDYSWKKSRVNYKLEISGVNSCRKDCFSKRISSKKQRFLKVSYDQPFEKKLIAIIDFYFDKYCLIEMID